MKTWEMIKELTENPKKRFESDSYEFKIGATAIGQKGGQLSVDYHILILGAEWEEVKPKVGWDKALEYMKKSQSNQAKLFSNVYRFGYLGNDYLMVWENSLSAWEKCFLLGTMIDSKEWELLCVI